MAIWINSTSLAAYFQVPSTFCPHHNSRANCLSCPGHRCGGRLFEQSQALGSVRDYVSGDPYAVGENEDEVSALGIEVANGESKLTRELSVTGIKVISVDPDGPAAIAGLQSERMIGRTALTAALAVGGMVFPPAMFMAVLVSQGDVGESHDLIIAVDGERTRNIADLQDALSREDGGEIVYLVVVRAGRRECIAVRLPGELPPYKTD